MVQDEPPADSHYVQRHTWCGVVTQETHRTLEISCQETYNLILKVELRLEHQTEEEEEMANTQIKRHATSYAGA